jgi:3,4-dihydroxy-2-butanone 4-phosphate synthase
MTFTAVERAIDAVKRGEFVVVVDDEDRENEGDLIIAAEKMTPDKMAFMIRYTSGVICLPPRVSAPRSRCRSTPASERPPGSRRPIGARRCWR